MVTKMDPVLFGASFHFVIAHRKKHKQVTNGPFLPQLAANKRKEKLPSNNQTCSYVPDSCFVDYVQRKEVLTKET